MGYLQYSKSLLVPLQRLRSLHTLRLSTTTATHRADIPAWQARLLKEWSKEGLDVVCQLTGLRQLELLTSTADLEWLQLAQMKGLTRLDYGSESGVDCFQKVCFVQQVGVLSTAGLLAN